MTTIARHFAWNLTRLLIAAAITTIAFLAIPPTHAATPDLPGSVDAMFAANHCWSDSGTHPKPTHALVDLGDGPELAPASVGFGIWLDGRPGVVHGFCK